MIWCFGEDDLKKALAQFRQIRVAEGHKPEVVDACIAGVTAFLRSEHGRKLRVPDRDNEAPQS